MHRKCLVQHLAWAGMQEVIIVTSTTISSFALGCQRSHRLQSGGVRPLLPLTLRTGEASRPGSPDSWDLESSMSLSPGSL